MPRVRSSSLRNFVTRLERSEADQTIWIGEGRMEKDAGREGEENVKFISRVESSSRILKYLIHLSLRKRSWKLGDARDSLASSTTSFRESHGIFESITTSTRAPRSYYIKFLFLSRSEWLLFFFLEEEGLFEGQRNFRNYGIAKKARTMILKRMNSARNVHDRSSFRYFVLILIPFFIKIINDLCPWQYPMLE